MDEELVAPEVLDELEELFELLSDAVRILRNHGKLAGCFEYRKFDVREAVNVFAPQLLHQIIQIIAKPCHLFAMESAQDTNTLGFPSANSRIFRFLSRYKQVLPEWQPKRR